MSAGAIAVLVVLLIILIAAASVGVGSSLRRRGLRKRFGPEYDRTIAARPSRRQAETDLVDRARRVQRYHLRDLSDPARKLYGAQWADVQELFVESPAEAIADGRTLVEAVMRERGYPRAEFDQMISDLSVGHAHVLDHFRAAHEISGKAARGQASTEELRVALLYYRELFSELLGAPAAARDRSCAPGGKVPAAASRPVTAASGQIRR